MSRGDQARRLRQRSGLAADAVWRLLRGGRVDGFKFRREHPVGPYFADFACRDLRLIVEIDGDIHDLPEVALRDLERTATLEAEGWTVIRFDNDAAISRTTEVVEAVRRHAKVLGLS